MKDKNKRRVSMLLNAQTVYHLNKEAERMGVSLGEVVDRLVRESRVRYRKVTRKLPQSFQWKEKQYDHQKIQKAAHE